MTVAQRFEMMINAAKTCLDEADREIAQARLQHIPALAAQVVYHIRNAKDYAPLLAYERSMGLS